MFRRLTTCPSLRQALGNERDELMICSKRPAGEGCCDLGLGVPEVDVSGGAEGRARLGAAGRAPAGGAAPGAGTGSKAEVNPAE